MSGTLIFTPPPITLSVRDPADVTDYMLDFSNVIPNDTIAGAPTVSASPAGLTVVAVTVQAGYAGASKAVSARISGGVAQTLYRVTTVIQTAAGDTFSRSVTLPCAYR